MASLTKRPDSSFWIACFTDADGRQLKRSTKTTDRKEAVRIATEFEAAAKGAMTVKQAHTVLSGLLAGNGMTLNRMTVEQWISQWLERRKREIAGATLAAYEWNMRNFLRWLERRAQIPLATLSTQDMYAYREHLLETKRVNTVNQCMLVLNIMLNAAWREGHIPDNPMRLVKRMRADTRNSTEPRGRQPFTRDQIKRLLDVASPEWRSMILAGLYTGQRLTDIALLKWENVNFADGTIRIQTSKTGKRLTLPIAPALREHLEQWNAGRSERDKHTPPSFRDRIHPQAAQRIERTGLSTKVSSQFARLLERAGIREADTDEAKAGRNGHTRISSLTFHSLRHTATSWMKEAGIPQSVVQDFIGHDTATMSRIYTHTSIGALQQAANALPEL